MHAALLLTAALACPFCEAPGLTLSDQLAESDIVILGEWLEADRGGDASPAFTRYLVKKSLKGPYMPGKKLKLRGYQSGELGETLLLTAGGGEFPEWDLPVPISADGFAYLKNNPGPDSPPEDRLRYYLKHLQHPDDLVASDAYGEFGNVPFEEVEAIKDELPREKLAVWILDPETDPSRLAFYGMLLGLCGEPGDADILRAKIFEGTDEFRIGIDGLMSGLLLLTGEEGLKELEDAKLRPKYIPGPNGEPLTDENGEPIPVPFSEVYAAMQAVRFMWTYGGDRIPAERLKEALRLQLAYSDLAEVVIADLSRWKDWAAMERIAGLYTKEGYDVPAVKRAIISYLLEAERDVPEDAAEGPSEPPHVVAAKKHLAAIEAEDPELVKRARDTLYSVF
ncbi:hypothetical protein [Alienimonas chondri]|uniref:HEAT repeat domain-containing protein n=1 Tax=Alienimonas chondri TaxID=2681879 RepID=A0ABX1VF24_9PLAN|nr:hypothetical protein [Alienimonas chondri]NNJ26329.1 hypothetical protein [Alienimonas chondri]